MKEKITHNLGLKILSVVIAFLVWLIVVNVSNPEVTDSVNVPLEVLNGDVLANAGLSYKIENKVKVSISDGAIISVYFVIDSIDISAIPVILLENI